MNMQIPDALFKGALSEVREILFNKLLYMLRHELVDTLAKLERWGFPLLNDLLYDCFLHAVGEVARELPGE